MSSTKTKLLQLKLIHIFARAILLMKKLKIEKTKPTFIGSVLKVEYTVALVSSILNFFINKISLANTWRRTLIHFCSNSASVLNICLDNFETLIKILNNITNNFLKNLMANVIKSNQLPLSLPPAACNQAHGATSTPVVGDTAATKHFYSLNHSNTIEREAKTTIRFYLF